VARSRENGSDFVFPLWHKALLVNENGSAKVLLANAITVLRMAPEMAGCIKFNDLRAETMAATHLPWDNETEKPRPWSNHDDLMLADWLQHQYVFIGAAMAGEAVQAVAELPKNHYHPIKNYLEGEYWDGEHRLDEWAIKYLGCEDTPYVRAVSSKWMISAVARIDKPGCKVDSSLVLEGPQGIGKSTALRKLGEPWFTDELAAIGTKNASEQTIGVWIIELSELEAVTRAADVAHVKAFMSRPVDRFRYSYGKRVGEYARQCVFAATTNSSNWNRDDTGGRRWWPLVCGKIDCDGLSEMRGQLWAEAHDRYLSGELWHLESRTDEQRTVINEAEKKQKSRTLEDSASEGVEKFLSGTFDETVTTAQVMSGVGIPIERQDKPATMRFAAILKNLGWTRMEGVWSPEQKKNIRPGWKRPGF